MTRRGLAVLVVCCLVSACATHPAAGGRSHPLEGRMWDVAGDRFIAADAVYQRAASSRYVLLVERHDITYHHAMQQAELQALA